MLSIELQEKLAERLQLSERTVTRVERVPQPRSHSGVRTGIQWDAKHTDRSDLMRLEQPRRRSYTQGDELMQAVHPSSEFREPRRCARGLGRKCFTSASTEGGYAKCRCVELQRPFSLMADDGDSSDTVEPQERRPDTLVEELAKLRRERGRAATLEEELRNAKHVAASLQRENAKLSEALLEKDEVHQRSVDSLAEEFNKLLRLEISKLEKRDKEIVRIHEELAALKATNADLSAALFEKDQAASTPPRRLQSLDRSHLDEESTEAGSRSPSSECSTFEASTQTEPEQATGQADREESAESRLRAALISTSTTAEQLREAVGAVSAVVDEAKRELAAKEVRERRAAFESLHQALASTNEEEIEQATARARRAGIDAEDISKAEAKLVQLRSMTDEQREQQRRQAWETEQKKMAFLLVKKDDANKLRELLGTLEQQEVDWQRWRDHASRSLWKYAQDLRSSCVQDVLAPYFVKEQRPTARMSRQFIPEQVCDNLGPATASASSSAPGTQEENQGADAANAAVDQPSVVNEIQEGAAMLSATSMVRLVSLPDGLAGASPRSLQEPPTQVAGDVSPCPEFQGPAVPISEEEERKLKPKAFRSVVQNDIAVLKEVIDFVPMSMWSSWQNKAGKCLLTLAEERGSSEAYSVLAKALGIVQEQAREFYEEREDVWIYLPGEVQARRATVCEETSSGLDEILIEFWDGDDPAQRVPRCMVRKITQS